MVASGSSAAPLRRRSPARTLAAVGLVGVAIFGLSACRTIGPDADAEKAREQAKAEVASVAPASESQAAPTGAGEPATTPQPAATPQLGDPLAVAKAREEAAANAAAAGPDTTDEAAADDAQADAVSAAKAGEDPGAGAVKSERAESGPSKPLDPWRLVGQPYLVDDESPEPTAPDGLTTYTLWFRTKGEFRGVRAGTSITDDRHYKVGLVTFPELPGYVPGGIGMLQRSDAMVRKGRYCYTAEVHLQGKRGSRRFPIRRDGAELQVEMDLRGAPVQRRTVTVVVRDAVSSDPPITPVEEALACR
jgi:hypothetical protein